MGMPHAQISSQAYDGLLVIVDGKSNTWCALVCVLILCNVVIKAFKLYSRYLVGSVCTWDLYSFGTAIHPFDWAVRAIDDQYDGQ